MTCLFFIPYIFNIIYHDYKLYILSFNHLHLYSYLWGLFLQHNLTPIHKSEKSAFPKRKRAIEIVKLYTQLFLQCCTVLTLSEGSIIIIVSTRLLQANNIVHDGHFEKLYYCVFSVVNASLEKQPVVCNSCLLLSSLLAVWYPQDCYNNIVDIFFTVVNKHDKYIIVYCLH